MATWLAGLQLWHDINYAPWYGCSHLKCVLQGASAAAPSTSRRPKRLAVTIAHLLTLKSNLSNSNIFDTAVLAITCIAFWGQCKLAELCIDGVLTHKSTQPETRCGAVGLQRPASNMEVFGHQAQRLPQMDKKYYGLTQLVRPVPSGLLKITLMSMTSCRPMPTYFPLKEMTANITQ